MRTLNPHHARPNLQEALMSRESDAPSKGQGRLARLMENGENLVVAILAIAAVVLGTIVTVFFPPPPGPLIVLGDAGATSAESWGESALYIDYEYVPGADLSDVPGSGVVYQLELSGDPLQILAGLGEVYGLEGTPEASQYFDEVWPGYVLGPEDWSGPTLNLTWSGTGPWYYSDPDAYQQPTCREIEPEESSEELGGFECENPEPSGPLPSVAEATDMAVELFQKSGLKVTASEVTVLANDEWGVGLSAIQTIEGVDTALEWSVFFAPGPTLASVSGHAATPQSRGVFDTVSPRDALERLESGLWWGSPAPLYHSGFDSVFEDSHSFDEPLSFEPGDVITVTVDSADEAPLLIWDAQGTAWLVPGYIMRHGDEPWNASAVISVEEGVIALPDPMMVEIMPIPEGEQS
ncbi:MAG: hypothetical protein VW805_04590 [Pontimonas sp.]